VADTPWLSDEEQRAWRGFNQLARQVTAHVTRELQRTTGLSGPDYEVLVLLSEAPQGSLRAFEIGTAAGWEKSRLSHHLTRMELRGLVRRQTCEADPRYADVVLTDEGRAAIEAAAPLHVEHVRRFFFAALTPEQVAAVDGLAETVLEHLATESTEPPTCSSTDCG
jgi:DNA-binding MarR family transcriptional regulator